MIHRDVEQRSEEWYSLRLGIPTASEFSKLVTPAKVEISKQLEDYAMVLAAEAWSKQEVDPWAGNVYTDNGIEMEDRARAYYALLTGRDTEDVGFVTSDSIEAGASPDALLEGGVLEIKNLGAKQHIRCLGMNSCPLDYLMQVQGQILVGWDDGIRWADLLLYSDQLPPKVFHVEPDQKIQDALKRAIEMVCKRRDYHLDVIRRAA